MANSEVVSAPVARSEAEPDWATWMRKGTDYLAQDFLGGPRPFVL